MVKDQSSLGTGSAPDGTLSASQDVDLTQLLANFLRLEKKRSEALEAKQLLHCEVLQDIKDHKKQLTQAATECKQMLIQSDSDTKNEALRKRNSLLGKKLTIDTKAFA